MITAAWIPRSRRATLHAENAGRALLAAPDIPSGIYNVCRNGERVSNRRITAFFHRHLTTRRQRIHRPRYPLPIGALA
jgi:hypothetical protein